MIPLTIIPPNVTMQVKDEFDLVNDKLELPDFKIPWLSVSYLLRTIFFL